MLPAPGPWPRSWQCCTLCHPPSPLDQLQRICTQGDLGLEGNREKFDFTFRQHCWRLSVPKLANTACLFFPDWQNKSLQCRGLVPNRVYIKHLHWNHHIIGINVGLPFQDTTTIIRVKLSLLALSSWQTSLQPTQKHSGKHQFNKKVSQKC